jgi:O-antigen/teichoic acid export membrane protein
LATAGQVDEFKRGFQRLVLVVATVGVVGVVGTLVAGPAVVDKAFAVDLGRGDLVLLAAGSATYMLGLAVAQALIALHGQNQVALSWLAAVGAFVVSVAVLAPVSLYPRIELALLIGSAVALVGMTACVVARTRGGAIVEPGDLIEALHDFPLEA